MCGLFGFSYYGVKRIKGLSDITNVLADESSIRGTDATGIAFNNGGRLNIVKDSKPAYKIDFKHPDDIKSLIGHTRHSTQGSEKKNYNNHPFCGKTTDTIFALAHNGVLTNDNGLRKTKHLPKTKIGTDSYIAVQLIESKKKLDFNSIRYMAETVEGSFSFSILDDKDNLYLVKGDSPISILHFPKQKIYVYASTDEILWKSLIETVLFDKLKSGEFEKIIISNGEILKIQSDGLLMRDKFDYTEYTYGNCKWWTYDTYLDCLGETYIDDLKSVASYQGYSPDLVDELLDGGFSPEEIEEYIYCCE